MHAIELALGIICTAAIVATTAVVQGRGLPPAVPLSGAVPAVASPPNQEPDCRTASVEFAGIPWRRHLLPLPGGTTTEVATAQVLRSRWWRQPLWDQGAEGQGWVQEWRGIRGCLLARWEHRDGRCRVRLALHQPGAASGCLLLLESLQDLVVDAAPGKAWRPALPASLPLPTGWSPALVLAHATTNETQDTWLVLRGRADAADWHRELVLASWQPLEDPLLGTCYRKGHHRCVVHQPSPAGPGGESIAVLRTWVEPEGRGT